MLEKSIERTLFASRWLIASIVAISGIHLLKSFMNIEHVNKTELKWMIILHMAFVISGVLLAYMDLLLAKTKKAAY